MILILITALLAFNYQITKKQGVYLFSNIHRKGMYKLLKINKFFKQN